MLTDQPIWLDIENPPQVQYLAPFVSAFQHRGRSVVVSARDAGITVKLLRQRRIPHTAIGGDPPAERSRKVLAVAHRAVRLARIARSTRPFAVICSSRAAALAACLARIPCFVVCDYEYAELGIYRRSGATLLHPEVVPTHYFERLGFNANRLIPFRGLKEDISFAGIGIDNTVPHNFGPVGQDLRVLVRPPAESSHYFDPRSRSLALSLLDHLSARQDVLTVFSPRHPHQVQDVTARPWRRTPVVLEQAVPFVSLLKGVDRVVSAGGTMLREAAYLGVPAYSLFTGHIGAVDAHLVRTGRLTVISSASDLHAITGASKDLPPFPRNEDIVEELTDTVLARARQHATSVPVD